MSTLAQLANRLRKEADEIAQNASDRAVDVALTIVADVAVNTPADKGKAISNWQVSLDSPVDNEIEPYRPGLQGSTAQSNVNAAYRNAKAVLENKQPGQTIYISNVTDYIGYLNDGSSTQQPAGFVERAVMVGEAKAKSSSVKVLSNGR